MDDEKKVHPKKKKIPVSGVRVSITEPVELKQTSQSSVELKRNSKGVVEFTIKIYGDDPQISARKALIIFKELEKKFKMP